MDRTEIMNGTCAIMGSEWGVFGNEDVGYTFGNGTLTLVVQVADIDSRTPEQLAIFILANAQ